MKKSFLDTISEIDFSDKFTEKGHLALMTIVVSFLATLMVVWYWHIFHETHERFGILFSPSEDVFSFGLFSVVVYLLLIIPVWYRLGRKLEWLVHNLIAIVAIPITFWIGLQIIPDDAGFGMFVGAFIWLSGALLWAAWCNKKSN